MTTKMWARLILGTMVVTSPMSAQAPRTRDSAGVHIVENAARLSRSVNLRLAEKAVFDVGGLDDNPDNEFNSHQGYLRGVPLAGGGFAAIDVSRVQYFNSAGKREWISGRLGSGPADLRYVTAICRTRGDTLVLSDSQNHRRSVLDEHGAIIRTIPMGDNGSMPFDACFGDGTFVLEKSLATPPGTPRAMRVTRMRLDGSIANVIGDFQAGLIDLVTMNEPTVLAAGNRFYFGSGQSSEIGVYDVTGKLLTLIRSGDPLMAISDADVSRRIASAFPNEPSAQDRVRSMPRSANWPAYARMHIDRQGRLWVEDYRKDYPAADGWSVFDAAGRLVGRLVLPAAPRNERQQEVIAFGDNSIIVRRTDADGAEHLSTYGVLGLGAERP